MPADSRSGREHGLHARWGVRGGVDAAVNGGIEGARPRRGRTTRNAVLALATAGVPAVVGVATMPYVVRGLGPPAFGVLSLAWVVLSIFAILDFGASRAATKRVAECRATGAEARIGAVVWTALALNAVISAASALVVVAGSGLLVERVLDVPAALHDEARIAFALLGLTIPATLAAGVLRSALEGAGRFDLTTAIQLPANAMNFVWPAIVVAFGGGLVPVVACICGTRFILVPLLLAGCRQEFPSLGGPRIDAAERRFLLSFGGWLTASSVIGPILLNLDRLLVGSLLGVRAVAFYAAPYEMVARLTMIPASLMSALFPAFSTLAVGARDQLGAAYRRAWRYIALAMVPVSAVLAAAAPELLDVWLGRDFADASSNVVRLLAMGLLALSLGSLPFNVLQATGRADVGARLHALELVPYAALAWWLVTRFGIVGAAAAWSVRAAVDCVLFHVAARRLGIGARLLAGDVAAGGLLGALGVALIGGASVLRATGAPPSVAAAALAASAVLYIAVGWRYVLVSSDRDAARAWVGRVALRRPVG